MTGRWFDRRPVAVPAPYQLLAPARGYSNVAFV